MRRPCSSRRCWPPRSRERWASSRSPDGCRGFERLVLAGGTAALLVGLAVAVPSTADRPDGVPAAFGSRLAALPAGTPVAVEDATGAWIEWKYPGLNPVIDGMLDAYSVDYIKRYADYVDVKPGWQDFLADSKAGSPWSGEDSPCSDAMRRQLHWRAGRPRPDKWVYLEAPGQSTPPEPSLAKTDFSPAHRPYPEVGRNT